MADGHILEQVGHVTLLVRQRLRGQPELMAHLHGLVGTALGSTALEGEDLWVVLAVGQGTTGVGVGDVAQRHLALDLLICHAGVGSDAACGQQGQEDGSLGHDAADGKRRGVVIKNERAIVANERQAIPT